MTEANEDHDDETPGWDAITAACERLYGPVEPLHIAAVPHWRLGGNDPLDGISAYRNEGPQPHWHFVSYGMSELYGKESDDPDESGWGFEFTFRLVRDPAADAPPTWPVTVMQSLARYVVTTRKWFEPGHILDARGPVATDRDDSAIRALAFTEDPELGAIDTPHGRVRFLQVVGITLDEHKLCLAEGTGTVLERLAAHSPLLVTDIDRA